MAGLFDFFSPGTQGQGSGLLGNFNDYVQGNQGALLGMGLGLMSGQGTSDAYAQALNGYMAGQRQDFTRRQLKQKEQEEEQKRIAAQTMAKSLGLDPSIAQNPDAVSAIYQTVTANKLTPKEPSFQERLFNSLPTDQRADATSALLGLNKSQDKWELKTIKNSDGSETPVYFNPRTAETRPVQGYAAGPSKAAQQEEQKRQAAQIVVDDAQRAIDITNDSNVKVPYFGWDTGINTATGRTGQVLKNIGGTNAANVSALVDTIKANASFDKLQEMRKNSPTGAGLGGVSDTDMKLLGSVIGNLEQSQTREQFQTNLKRVRKTYGEIIHGRGNVDDDGNPKGGSAQRAIQGKTRNGVSWSVD